MTNDQLLEKVARSMCAPFYPDETVLLGTYKKRWETHIDQAQAAIDTIRDDLLELNAGMIVEVYKRLDRDHRFTSPDHQEVIDMLRAVIAASPLGGQKDG